MKSNMGKIDRVVRILIAVAMTSLYALQIVTGTLGIVLMTFSIVFVITSFIGFCPLYFPLGISTRKNKNTGAA